MMLEGLVCGHDGAQIFIVYDFPPKSPICQWPICPASAFASSLSLCPLLPAARSPHCTPHSPTNCSPLTLSHSKPHTPDPTPNAAYQPLHAWLAPQRDGPGQGPPVYECGQGVRAQWSHQASRHAHGHDVHGAGVKGGTVDTTLTAQGVEGVEGVEGGGTCATSVAQVWREAELAERWCCRCGGRQGRRSVQRCRPMQGA
eukprot:366458-Chlamydomonas_euryale.AAC.29